jgi:hypothetical protein
VSDPYREAPTGRHYFYGRAYIDLDEIVAISWVNSPYEMVRVRLRCGEVMESSERAGTALLDALRAYRGGV